MIKNKVCHLTSVHPRFDIRIFLKECCSLESFGYDVSLVVADGKGDEVSTGITIFDVGISQGRIARVIKTTRRVFKRALALNADVYHLHDPELIPVGLKLKKIGKKVIFDAHEDFPKQLLGKPYLNKLARIILSRTISLYEQWGCAKLDGIVTATPSIRDKFEGININTLNVNNFPLKDELVAEQADLKQKKQVCYVGGLSCIRGAKEIVRSMGITQSAVRLKFAGNFGNQSLEDACKCEAGWKNVDTMGFLERPDVCELLRESVAGIVTFLPTPNHINSQPNKMFEYMAAGIPVIASDFPLWREIIEGNDCGLCVDPQDPPAIAKAIDFLATNPECAQQMGENGRRAVRERYNWSIEEHKLLNLYKNLLS